MMLLNNPNTHQFYFGPDDEHNILFRNMNDTVPFHKMATAKKRPNDKIKCYVETVSMLYTCTSMWTYNMETEVKEGKLCEEYSCLWLQELKA
jgi:hypothetical protein